MPGNPNFWQGRFELAIGTATRCCCSMATMASSLTGPRGKIRKSGSGRAIALLVHAVRLAVRRGAWTDRIGIGVGARLHRRAGRTCGEQ